MYCAPELRVDQEADDHHTCRHDGTGYESTTSSGATNPQERHDRGRAELHDRGGKDSLCVTAEAGHRQRGDLERDVARGDLDDRSRDTATTDRLICHDPAM